MIIKNELGLPQPFVDAATRERSYTPLRYSTTEILKGTTEVVLSRRHAHEAEDDVADRVWAIFGTAVHHILEQGRETDSQIKEGFISTEVDVDGKAYTLTGIFDLYDAETGTVTDYKTCSVWKTQVGDYEDWKMQTLIYCWMLRRAGYDAHRAEIVAIMRDHSRRKAATEKGYPEHPVLKVPFEFTDDDFSFAELFVMYALRAIDSADGIPDDELEPCSEGDRWHKPDSWAVVKDGNKRAARVLGSQADADSYRAALEQRTGKPHHVEFRRGEDSKCEGYCRVAKWCPYGKSIVEKLKTSVEN